MGDDDEDAEYSDREDGVTGEDSTGGEGLGEEAADGKAYCGGAADGEAHCGGAAGGDGDNSLQEEDGGADITGVR